MRWAAVIVVLALGATSALASEGVSYAMAPLSHYGKPHYKTKRPCRRAGDRRCRKHVHRRRAPSPSPPAPGPAPAPAPTPAPTPGPGPPTLPSRTSVDLTDDDTDGWRVTPAYRELKAGQVEFNANNLGMDDHDFSVRDAGGTVLANEVVLTGESVTVRLSLAPAVYTLYCSIADHETRGMRADITIR